MQEAAATNSELLELPEDWVPHDTRQVLAVISAEMRSDRETTRLAALHWMTTLLAKSRSTVSTKIQLTRPLKSVPYYLRYSLAKLLNHPVLQYGC